MAVKIILENGESNHDALQTRLFLEEIKVMTKVGRHLNIVNLLGHVTAGISLEDVLTLANCAL